MDAYLKSSLNSRQAGLIGGHSIEENDYAARFVLQNVQQTS